MIEEEKKKYQKQYGLDHKEEKKQYGKRYNKQYRLDHKEEIKQYGKRYNKQYSKRRRLTDINFKMRDNLRRRLNNALKGNTKVGSSVRDLGISIDDFKKYIASKFQDGMTWKNYGEWHLDHFVPLSMFNLQEKEQFLIACNYTNIQPLWAKDNLIKHNLSVLDYRDGFF